MRTHNARKYLPSGQIYVRNARNRACIARSVRADHPTRAKARVGRALLARKFLARAKTARLLIAWTTKLIGGFAEEFDHFTHIPSISAEFLDFVCQREVSSLILCVKFIKSRVAQEEIRAEGPYFRACYVRMRVTYALRA